MDTRRIYTAINENTQQSGFPLAQVAHEVAEEAQDGVAAFSPQASAQMLRQIESSVYAVPSIFSSLGELRSNMEAAPPPNGNGNGNGILNGNRTSHLEDTATWKKYGIENRWFKLMMARQAEENGNYEGAAKWMLSLARAWKGDYLGQERNLANDPTRDKYFVELIIETYKKVVDFYKTLSDHTAMADTYMEMFDFVYGRRHRFPEYKELMAVILKMASKEYEGVYTAVQRRLMPVGSNEAIYEELGDLQMKEADVLIGASNLAAWKAGKEGNGASVVELEAIETMYRLAADSYDKTKNKGKLANAFLNTANFAIQRAHLLDSIPEMSDSPQRDNAYISAAEHYKKALELTTEDASRAVYYDRLMEIELQLINPANRRDRLREAETYMEAAVEAYKKSINDKRFQLDVYAKAAGLLDKKGEYARAHALWFRAAEFSEGLDLSHITSTQGYYTSAATSLAKAKAGSSAGSNYEKDVFALVEKAVAALDRIEGKISPRFKQDAVRDVLRHVAAAYMEVREFKLAKNLLWKSKAFGIDTLLTFRYELNLCEIELALLEKDYKNAAYFLDMASDMNFRTSSKYDEAIQYGMRAARLRLREKDYKGAVDSIGKIFAGMIKQGQEVRQGEKAQKTGMELSALCIEIGDAVSRDGQTDIAETAYRNALIIFDIYNGLKVKEIAKYIGAVEKLAGVVGSNDEAADVFKNAAFSIVDVDMVKARELYLRAAERAVNPRRRAECLTGMLATYKGEKNMLPPEVNNLKPLAREVVFCCQAAEDEGLLEGFYRWIRGFQDKSFAVELLLTAIPEDKNPARRAQGYEDCAEMVGWESSLVLYRRAALEYAGAGLNVRALGMALTERDVVYLMIRDKKSRGEDMSMETTKLELTWQTIEDFAKKVFKTTDSPERIEELYKLIMTQPNEYNTDATLMLRRKIWRSATLRQGLLYLKLRRFGDAAKAYFSLADDSKNFENNTEKWAFYLGAARRSIYLLSAEAGRGDRSDDVRRKNFEALAELCENYLKNSEDEGIRGLMTYSRSVSRIKKVESQESLIELATPILRSMEEFKGASEAEMANFARRFVVEYLDNGGGTRQLPPDWVETQARQQLRREQGIFENLIASRSWLEETAKDKGPLDLKLDAEKTK